MPTVPVTTEFPRKVNLIDAPLPASAFEAAVGLSISTPSAPLKFVASTQALLATYAIPVGTFSVISRLVAVPSGSVTTRR